MIVPFWQVRSSVLAGLCHIRSNHLQQLHPHLMTHVLHFPNNHIVIQTSIANRTIRNIRSGTGRVEICRLKAESASSVSIMYHFVFLERAGELRVIVLKRCMAVRLHNIWYISHLYLANISTSLNVSHIYIWVNISISLKRNNTRISKTIFYCNTFIEANKFMRLWKYFSRQIIWFSCLEKVFLAAGLAGVVNGWMY